MSTWRVKPGKLDERETDYSADFVCTNLDTGKQVTITLQQMKLNHPTQDLVEACRALSALLMKHAADDDEQGADSTPDSSAVARLH